MAKIISTAQKTFVDLYDSYVLNIGPDVVAVPCNKDGVATETRTTDINYTVSVGTKSIVATCKLISTCPNGVVVTTSVNGKISIKVNANTNLNDDLKLAFKITTTDSNAFVFDKYITFIKIKAGENGKDGRQVVTFRVYSEDGDTFKEGVDEITLETVAFDGLTQITNATYKWSYYATASNEWVDMVNTGSFLTVNKSSSMDTVIKCVMTYNKQTYEDYFTIKYIQANYDVVVKFFGGSNIFDAAEPFIVAYLELYKNQQEEEMLKTQNYYYHTGNTYDVTAKKYTFNSTGINSNYNVNGTLMYIIYKIINAPDDNGAKYKVRLCQYNNGWASASSATYGNHYVYRNDLYDDLYEDIATNIIVISKEDVVKYRDINFTVYTKATDNGGYVYDNDLIVSRNYVTVIDLNDPVISATAPENPKDGQLWLNTSSAPYTLYIYQNGKWVYFTQQNGKTVYTSRPTSYSVGDLWILGPGEICGSFREGSMLRAKQTSSSYSAAHWEDAMEAMTILKTNIDQYFAFDKTTGLKIGQTDGKFYVNINSQKMGFYDNSTGQNKEVVYISNSSANIDGLTVETNLDVTCPAKFSTEVDLFGFVFKKESNGSLSLALRS